MSRLNLIGEHVGGFVVQTIRVAIDDLEITSMPGRTLDVVSRETENEGVV